MLSKCSFTTLVWEVKLGHGNLLWSRILWSFAFNCEKCSLVAHHFSTHLWWRKDDSSLWTFCLILWSHFDTFTIYYCINLSKIDTIASPFTLSKFIVWTINSLWDIKARCGPLNLIYLSFMFLHLDQKYMYETRI